MHDQVHALTEDTPRQHEEAQTHVQQVQAQDSALSQLTLPSLAMLAVVFWRELQHAGTASTHLLVSKIVQD
jgi:hypothetical protein